MHLSGFHMMGGSFSLFYGMFGFIFAVVFCIIIIRIIRGIGEWSSNNNSPIVDVEAIVVAKRQNTTHSNHMAGGNQMHHSSSTYYYVTFELESGSRMELKVKGTDYGLLVEGDVGKLRFQGTRYLGFDRKIQ